MQARFILPFFLALAVASADPIYPGYDLYATAPGSTFDAHSVDSSLPLVVPVIGIPVGGALGNTDTIVQRLPGTAYPVDSGAANTPVDIQPTELNLQSVDPITVVTKTSSDQYFLQVQ